MTRLLVVLMATFHALWVVALVRPLWAALLWAVTYPLTMYGAYQLGRAYSDWWAERFLRALERAVEARNGR